ncbi:hypothetical protein [Terribacillus saccharophilus]|uniref:hypothetical protein n=1 Tax=Terribacillus saccharophilus TaxID=361277 RepID=UPI001595FBD5|nr:hypothetical protein [Terribacillus saccharophilus]
MQENLVFLRLKEHYEKFGTIMDPNELLIGYAYRPNYVTEGVKRFDMYLDFKRQAN